MHFILPQGIKGHFPNPMKDELEVKSIQKLIRAAIKTENRPKFKIIIQDKNQTQLRGKIYINLLFINQFFMIFDK